MIYDGVITKPPLDELYHEKAHKYIERYKSKTGKWVYKYTKPVDDAFKKREERIEEKKKKDPYYGMSPKSRAIIKTSEKAAEKIVEGTRKTKKSLRKVKLNGRYGRNNSTNWRG